MKLLNVVELVLTVGPEVFQDYTKAKAAFEADGNNLAKAKTAAVTAETLIVQLGEAALKAFG